MTPGSRMPASRCSVPSAARVLALTAVMLLPGCGVLRGKKDVVSGSAPPPEVKAAVGKGDSAISMDLGFGSMDTATVLSAAASDLYLKSLDNFLAVAGDDPKALEVRLWKGNHLYNQGDYARSLEVYEAILKGGAPEEVKHEALQMSAQANAQLGHYEEAEKLYRGMLGGSDAESRKEAKERLSQAIYLQAEKAEREKRLQTASDLYARVAREFPTVEIAPVALFNAGVMQEKQKQWKEAIKLYGTFFDVFYENKLLTKVLFREAKCRELDGQWAEAGSKYLNLVRTYPQSPEAEPALYNAGFAFVNGKLPDSAARAFETYAITHPQNAEAPNLLFRAVEIHGELKNWDRVAELQALFTRRYASDKGRLIQALCMGGTAAWKRRRLDEAVQLMRRVTSEFATLKTQDPTARYYAAQAQYTLGEIAGHRMREAPLRPGSLDEDIRSKSGLLKAAVGEYLKVLEYRIVDWALRTAYALGESFEDFGTQVYEGPRKSSRTGTEQLDREEEALAALSSAYAKAQQQYLQVLSVGRKQEVNNKYVEDADSRLVAMAKRLAVFQARTKAMVPQILKVDASSPEKAIAGKLRQIDRVAPIQEEGLKYFNSFLNIAREYEIDSRTTDSLGGMMLGGLRDLGGHYLDAAELARGAPLPKGFQPMERFFYKAKLVQEGIPKLEEKAMEIYQQGLDFAEKYGLGTHPMTDSLGLAMGRALFIQAKCLDLLATEALVNPPIPAEAGPEQRKTYQERLENEGYQLQDQAIARYRLLVEKAVAGMVPVAWGEMAFARLYQIEPDKWSRTADVDTVLEIVSGKEWTALAELPGGQWPADGDPAWRKVRKGVVRPLAYAPHVRTPFRFVWCGVKGLGPKVDTIAATYIPWKEVRAQ
ncbi:MAG TPA: tetratricopeptide repeat protein, partial [Fibrobacteria bacterium]|nr:tetratricopeptide repeat protein [Fibrobacteria bacterium]